MSVTLVHNLVSRPTGLADPAGVAPAGAFVVPDNDGNLIVRAKNTGGSPADVTFTPQATIAGMSFADETYTLAAGATEWLGPFPPAIFNDSNGDLLGTAAAGIELTVLGI